VVCLFEWLCNELRQFSNEFFQTSQSDASEMSPSVGRMFRSEVKDTRSFSTFCDMSTLFRTSSMVYLSLCMSVCLSVSVSVSISVSVIFVHPANFVGQNEIPFVRGTCVTCVRGPSPAWEGKSWRWEALVGTCTASCGQIDA